MEARFSTQHMVGAKACPADIKMQFQQAKRRNEALEKQKQNREQHVSERRGVANETQTSNDSEIDQSEISKFNDNKKISELAQSMMNPEWMFEVPENIESWLAVLCPQGKRCLLIAQDNVTVSIDKCGKTMFERFSSFLPFGHNSKQMGASNCKRTILDCVFNSKLNTFYILDVIEWRGTSYIDFDVNFRFFFLQSRLYELPGLSKISPYNEYLIKEAPRMIAGSLDLCLLEDCRLFPNDVQLDGINFYHPDGLYMPSCTTPLVLWLKPFMIPDVLKIPVNDWLAQFDKPPNYVNVFEYSQSTENTPKHEKEKMEQEHAMECEMSAVEDG